MWCSCSTWKHKSSKRNPHTLRSAYPITDSGDDAVKVLDFALQQNHSGFLSAVLVGMVQHHVKKVTELGSDAGVLESWNKYLHSISKRNTFFFFFCTAQLSNCKHLHIRSNQSLRFCASGILNAHIQTVQICHRKYLSSASLTAKLVSWFCIKLIHLALHLLGNYTVRENWTFKKLTTYMHVQEDGRQNLSTCFLQPSKHESWVK